MRQAWHPFARLFVFFPLLAADASAVPPIATAKNQSTDTAWSQFKVGKDSALASNGHLIHPAGKILSLDGRVESLAIARQGRFLLAKTENGLTVVNAESLEVIKQSRPINPHTQRPLEKDRGSMYGLVVGQDGSTVYYTGRTRFLYTATIDERGVLSYSSAINLAIGTEICNPLGVAVVPKQHMAVVALAVANQVAIVDLKTEKVAARIPVGVCPYGVAVAPDGKSAFVSNFGGPHPVAGERSEKSAGSNVAVDARAISLRGSVSVIDLRKQTVVGEIVTRIHPEAMTLSPDGKVLYVVDASGDGIDAIDVASRKSVRTINTKPRADLPYGSLTCGLAVSADGQTLFTANAGNNAVAMFDLRLRGEPPLALISAGGFPGSVCTDGKNLYIGNVVGHFGASVQKVAIPTTDEERRILTTAAEVGYHLSEILRTQARAANGARPKPVPDNPGEPSTIKHVVYIIKENKKFDQVLGDMGRGNCEPRFCEFPRATSPNTHALADRFVLLDNYYCNGVLSCDGHQWADQGITTPYREKDWEGTHAAYDFGVDPLCNASCGCIWDHALSRGLSFRNFGESGNSEKVVGGTWSANYRAWKTKPDEFKVKCLYYSDVLRAYSDPRYAGWALNVPDQQRADTFLAALHEFETAGKLPELITIALPNDHGSGGKRDCPTPRAYVADNDLALGRIIEGLSKSRFWKDVVVFVNEDDPQTGVDHVDGHRSLCLVAGPYVKRGALVGRFYNQSSVLHTICTILGVPPMNQLVASSPQMSECFCDVPDFTPYVCLPANVPIDEMNPSSSQIKSKVQARLAPLTEKLDFSQPDLIDKDADLFSRFIWSTVRGDEPFPAEYAGAHGKGLKALGLRLAPEVDDGD